jgi:multidrug efflux pump subunit AcrB
LSIHQKSYLAESELKELDELDDVIITSPTTGQVLRFNGTNWVDDYLTLNDIANVNTAGATTGEFLKFDGTDWVPDSIPTINALDDIGDVNVTAAVNGDVLKFNGTNWVPLSNVATESYVDTAVSNLIDTAQFP